MFLNFSKENQVQLLNAISNKDFVEFTTYEPIKKIYSLYEIDESLNTNCYFKAPTYKNTIPEYLSILGLTQA